MEPHYLFLALVPDLRFRFDGNIPLFQLIAERLLRYKEALVFSGWNVTVLDYCNIAGHWCVR